jgi:hypothetical protein
MTLFTFSLSLKVKEIQINVIESAGGAKQTLVVNR